MNYHLKNKEKNIPLRNFYIFVGIFIFLSFLRIFFGQSISSFFINSLKPVWFQRTAFSDDNNVFFEYFYTKNRLLNENKNLKAEIENLKLKNIELEAIKTEYLSLVDLKKDETDIFSKVVSKPPFSPYDIFILDKGSSSGVNIGQDVYVGSSTYIGKISFVSPFSSEVSLFSIGGREKEVYIERTNTNLKIYGKGGMNFEAVVPKDLDIVLGDVLIYKSSPISSIIAKVYKIDETLQGSFKTIYMRLPISLSNIYFVNIRNTSL